MFGYLKSYLKGWLENKERRRLRNLIEKTLKKKHLSSWEKTFISSIEKRDLLSLSEKQVSKLEEICSNPDRLRIRGRGNPTVFDVAWDIGKEVDRRFSNKYGVSYDDVHDFDR